MSAVGQAVFMTLFMAYSVGFLFFIAHACGRHAPKEAAVRRTPLAAGILMLGLPLCLLVLLVSLLQ